MKRIKVIVLCILSLLVQANNNNQAGSCGTFSKPRTPKLQSCDLCAAPEMPFTLAYRQSLYMSYTIDSTKAEEALDMLLYGDSDKQIDSAYTAEAKWVDKKHLSKWVRRNSVGKIKRWAHIVAKRQCGRDNVLFKKRIAKIESYNSWNPAGCKKSQFWGKYQIGQSVRQQLGIFGISRHAFVKDTVLQEASMDILMKLNRIAMGRHIRKYHGQTVNGYYLTESGLLAMAHHMGATAIMNWLDHGCVDVLMDGNKKLSTDYLSVCANLNLKF